MVSTIWISHILLINAIIGIHVVVAAVEEAEILHHHVYNEKRSIRNCYNSLYWSDITYLCIAGYHEMFFPFQRSKPPYVYQELQ